MNHDWAICSMGTFARSAPITAFFHALLRALKEGKLLKRQSYIVTSSAGGIGATVALHESEDLFEKVERKQVNLRKRDFVDYHPKMKKNVAMDFMSMLALLGVAHLTGKIKSPWKSYAALAALAPATYKISERAVKHMFNAPSFLTYDNLHKLASEIFDFDAIFNSPIKIEMPAVDINTAGWMLNDILANPSDYMEGWKNEGWVSATNFRPEDVNLPKEERNANYLNGMINGMRVWAHFEGGKHKNRPGAVFDTAVISNMPLHCPIKEGYSKIVVLHFNSTAEGPTDKLFTRYMDSTNRCNDILVAESTKNTMIGYFKVNRDLAIMRKHEENLKWLEESLLHTFDATMQGQQAVREFIRKERELNTMLSYYNKKEIELIFVHSDPIPDAHFHDFTPEQIIEGHNIGWNTAWKYVPLINKMIEGK